MQAGLEEVFCLTTDHPWALGVMPEIPLQTTHSWMCSFIQSFNSELSWISHSMFQYNRGIQVDSRRYPGGYYFNFNSHVYF